MDHDQSEKTAFSEALQAVANDGPPLALPEQFERNPPRDDREGDWSIASQAPAVAFAVPSS